MQVEMPIEKQMSLQITYCQRRVSVMKTHRDCVIHWEKWKKKCKKNQQMQCKHVTRKVKIR